jgi:peptidoglycan/LPS O-acetylase OafA/YrhL
VDLNSYRPEIDGLRAVAVVSVFLFHLGLPLFSGGFVGVDVFFVISGYLITRLIYSDVSAGKFTFGRFYIRRTRRLAPALLLTLGASLVGSCLLMAPVHLAKFGTSLVAAIFSVSNILFWSESGYWDMDSSIKPLLHTWSLGVEEQFYLFWPALLWVLLRRSVATAVAGIVAVGVVSFALNLGPLGGVSLSSATLFYLLPFRVFEFAIGAILVWAPPLREGVAKEISPALGLAAILWSVLTFTEKTVFPSYNALVPCVGAALIIYGGNSKYVGAVLRNRVAVGIGLISYSLYLIHWPLIVFVRYYTMQRLTPSEQIAISVATLTSASLMYRYIETPFRRPRGFVRSNPIFFGLTFANTAWILAFAVALYRSAGWPERIPEYRIVQPIGTAQCGPALPDMPLVRCAVDRRADKTIFAWGDSHARVLLPGLASAFPDYNIKIFTSDGCRLESTDIIDNGPLKADDCGIYLKETFAFLLVQPPADVIIHVYLFESQAANVSLLRYYLAIMKRLESVGHHVVFLGDAIRPSIYLPDCYAVPQWVPDSAVRCSGNLQIVANLVEQNHLLKEWFGDRYVDPSPAFFENGHYRTRIGNQLMFEDKDHVAPFGSRWMIDFVKPQLKIGERKLVAAPSN